LFYLNDIVAKKTKAKMTETDDVDGCNCGESRSNHVHCHLLFALPQVYTKKAIYMALSAVLA
jgi:hypothetical protein